MPPQIKKQTRMPLFVKMPRNFLPSCQIPAKPVNKNKGQFFCFCFPAFIVNTGPVKAPECFSKLFAFFCYIRGKKYSKGSKPLHPCYQVFCRQLPHPSSPNGPCWLFHISMPRSGLWKICLFQLNVAGFFLALRPSPKLG